MKTMAIVGAGKGLGLFMKAGTGAANDPEVIADMWYQSYAGKLDGEDVYPKGVTPATVIM